MVLNSLIVDKSWIQWGHSISKYLGLEIHVSTFTKPLQNRGQNKNKKRSSVKHQLFPWDSVDWYGILHRLRSRKQVFLKVTNYCLMIESCTVHWCRVWGSVMLYDFVHSTKTQLPKFEVYQAKWGVIFEKVF